MAANGDLCHCRHARIAHLGGGNGACSSCDCDTFRVLKLPARVVVQAPLRPMNAKELADKRREDKEKIDAEVRQTFKLVFERLAPKVEAWILTAAEKNPARGADLLLRLSECFVPKLGRTDEDDGRAPVKVTILRENAEDHRAEEPEPSGWDGGSREPSA